MRIDIYQQQLLSYILLYCMKSVATLQFLELPLTDLLPEDADHIEFLRSAHPAFYEALQQLSKSVCTISYNLVSKFTPYGNEARLCLANDKFFYFCHDCSLTSTAALCKLCFDFNKHKNHTWVIRQANQKPFCDCGFSGKFRPGSTCTTHYQLINNDKKISKQEMQCFRSFFTLYTKIVVSWVVNITKGCEEVFKIYADLLRNLCKSSIKYTQQIHEIFMSPYTAVDKASVLQKFIALNSKSCKYQSKMMQLFTVICNYEPFQYEVTRALFTDGTKASNHEMIKQYCNYKSFFHLCKNPHILNKLAEEKICIYNVKPYMNYHKLDYYTEILKEYSFKNQRGLLMPVWRHFLSTDTIQHSISLLDSKQTTHYSSSYFFMILQDCTPDLTLTQQLIASLIKHHRLPYTKGYYSYSELFNQLVRIGLLAVNGCVQKFQLLFQLCDNLRLSVFVNTYLEELLKNRKKCNFNSLTAKCFLPLLKRFDLPRFTPTSKFSVLWIARILSVVLRNLTAYEYYENLEIIKIANLTGNVELAEEKKQLLLKWIQQYFYMRREVPCKLVSEFRKQGITKIPQISHFISTQTTCPRGCLFFQYKGPEVEVHEDLLLHSLSKGEQVYGLDFDTDKNLFYKPDRCELVNTLMTNVVRVANFDSFISHSKRDRYMISLTAVILNKMTKGQNQVFADYVQKVRQLSASMTTSCTPVDRLFKIKLFAPKMKPQNMKIEQKIEIKQEPIKQGEPVKEEALEEAKSEAKVEQKSQEIVKIEAKVQQTTIKQNECQIKSSQSLPEVSKVNQKREKKRNTFAQKFAARSQKFLNNFSQTTSEHNEKCLVCKQSKSDYGLLYYYSSLQTKRSILYTLYSKKNSKQNELSLSSCFHAVHEHCCPNKNARKCMLCTSQYDLFIPAVNNQMDQADKLVMLRLWWDDEFKRHIGKVYSKMGDTELFIMLFKSFVNTFDTIFLMPVKSASLYITRNQSYLDFLIYMFKIQDVPVQKAIIEQIHKYIKERISESTFISKVDAICAVSMFSKLDTRSLNNQERQFVISQLEQAKARPEFKYFGESFKSIEWLTGQKFVGFHTEFQPDPKLEELWKELNILSTLPKSYIEFRKLYEICKNKCSVLSSYLCLGCDKILCGACQKIENHISGSGCVCISLNDGHLYYQQRKTNTKYKKVIYCNFLMEPPSNSETNLEQYLLDKEALNDFLLKTVMLF